MKKKKSIPNEGQIKKSAQEKQDLLMKNTKNAEETKTMEKIFSGSCCHSGIHAYQKKSN